MKHAETAQAFLVVFKESVRGLSVGAPVEFRGVTLGEVAKINLEFDPRGKEFYIAVEIRLYPDRLRRQRAPGASPPEGSRAFIKEQIDRGLRAQLGSRNLLTGQRYIALEFFPKEPKVKMDWSRTPPEFPTTRAGQEELQATLTRIARKIEKMPLEEIAAEVRHAVQSLDSALQSADNLLRRTDAEIVPEARAVLDEARKTLNETRELLSEGAPLQHDLRETLRELTRAARSVRALADYLERYPEALIRGKKKHGR